jgi:hypothetical protein
MEEFSTITMLPPLSATAHFPRESTTVFPTRELMIYLALAFTTVAVTAKGDVAYVRFCLVGIDHAQADDEARDAVQSLWPQLIVVTGTEGCR